MPPSVFVSQCLLPLDSVKLGRFITNIDHPHQDYHDPPCAGSPRTIVQVRNQYHGFDEESSTSTFSSALTSFMSSALSKRTETKSRLSAERVQTYALDNSGSWFESATKLQETRQWLESAIDQGDDVFLVVGYHTVVDARITLYSSRAQARGGALEMPVGLSLAAAGVVAPLSDLINPGIGLRREEGSGVSEQFIAPGEQVCALQYRRVRYRFLSSKKIENASLVKSPRWAILDRCRDETEGEDDVIEVEAEDGLGEVDGKWARTLAPEDEVFIAPEETP